MADFPLEQGTGPDTAHRSISLRLLDRRTAPLSTAISFLRITQFLKELTMILILIKEHIMRCVLSFFTILAILQGLSWAEIYKYKNADGTMAFTDDLRRVPEGQRSKVNMMPQYVEPKTETKQHENDINSNLSWKDRNLIKILRQKGVIQSDVSEKEITPEYLAYLQLMLKREMGIDDITTWQPDRRLSSPEQTFELYRQAFKNGDLNLVLKCIMPRMRDLHQEMFKTMSADKLRQMGEGMSSIEKIEAGNGHAKYRIKRKEEHDGKTYGITYQIYFTDVFGEWRIEQL